MRTCRFCKLEKPSDDFYGRKLCTICRNKQIVNQRRKRLAENPELKAEYLEKNKLYLRELRSSEEGKTRTREYRKKYLSNPKAKEKHNARNSHWRKTEKGREYCNSYCRDRYYKDPEYYTMKRLAQRYGVDKGIFKEVLDRDKVCQLCGSSDRLEFDHIHPISLGGKIRTVQDMQLLCKMCNIFKSNNLLLPGGGMMIVSSGG